jgi:hypothetical protein
MPDQSGSTSAPIDARQFHDAGAITGFAGGGADLQNIDRDRLAR